MNETRLREAARALLAANDAERTKCREDNKDDPEYVCDMCREGEARDAALRAALASPEEPPPGMEEIERLVDAVANAAAACGNWAAEGQASKYRATRSALLSAIRRLAPAQGDEFRRGWEAARDASAQTLRGVVDTSEEDDRWDVIVDEAEEQIRALAPPSAQAQGERGALTARIDAEGLLWVVGRLPNGKSGMFQVPMPRTGIVGEVFRTLAGDAPPPAPPTEGRPTLRLSLLLRADESAYYGRGYHIIDTATGQEIARTFAAAPPDFAQRIVALGAAPAEPGTKEGAP